MNKKERYVTQRKSVERTNELCPTCKGSGEHGDALYDDVPMPCLTCNMTGYIHTVELPIYQHKKKRKQ